MGIVGYFANFVRSDGQLVANTLAVLHNSNNTGIMVETKIGKHTVEIYDAIDELPIVRFHRYQKLLLVDAGIGSDLSAFDQRIEKTRRFLMAEKNEEAEKELQNLRHCVFLIQSEINVKHLSFAALVKSIDGQPCEDLSDSGLQKVVGILSDVPEKELAAQLDAVKKKIDADLQLYFPKMFNDSNVKEYFDLLRKRTLAVFRAIANGEIPSASKEIEKLTTELVTYSNPKTFYGSDGVEVQFDRQFENLCLALSEQLHVKPKEYTVMEFYNAFEFIVEKGKESEKAQKRAKSRR